MITWLFDKCNDFGFLPNLIKDASLKPGTSEWWDLCTKPPFSYEFRFLKYCQVEKIQIKCELVDSIWSGPAYYPVNLNFYDPTIDYFSLMEPSSLDKLKQGRFKFLFYYSEGDDPNIEITKHLESIINKHGVDRNNVKFVTANYLVDNQNPFIYFPDDEVYYRYLHLNRKDWTTGVNLRQRRYKFTCLNRADKVWRRVYASNLFDLGLINEAQFSYTGYQYETPTKNEEDLNNWLKNNTVKQQQYISFGMQVPFKADELTDTEHNNHKLIDQKFFVDSYWNFVVETHFDQKTCFLTEKTFKCILNLQPFVIIGNPGSLGLLHHLGYKTFNKVVDEKYDKIQDPYSRMDELINVSYSLAIRPHRDQMNIIRLVKETVEFNQNRLLSPKHGRIMNLLNKLEY